ncbi:MAG: PIN domain-containing protein, partial [Candidatus Hydrogenedentota bacterium]
IITEASSSMSRPPFRRKWINFYNELLTNKRFEVVPPSVDLYVEGMTLYQDYHDKSWSLTDCISFVVMRDRGIAHALTADRHFEQAGFTIEFK